MSLYVKISKVDLERLHDLNASKTAYIKKLELAIESVERQLKNIKEANSAKT